MSDPNARIEPSLRVLYKATPRTQGGGCHLNVYLPDTAGGEGAPLML